jgi:hypothetical protein
MPYRISTAYMHHVNSTFTTLNDTFTCINLQFTHIGPERKKLHCSFDLWQINNQFYCV